MDLFCKATGMAINVETLWEISKQEKSHIAKLFPLKITDLEHGMKDLGFFSKPNQ